MAIRSALNGAVLEIARDPDFDLVGYGEVLVSVFDAAGSAGHRDNGGVRQAGPQVVLAAPSEFRTRGHPLAECRGVPSIGVRRQPLSGTADHPPALRGSWSAGPLGDRLRTGAAGTAESRGARHRAGGVGGRGRHVRRRAHDRRRPARPAVRPRRRGGARLRSGNHRGGPARRGPGRSRSPRPAGDQPFRARRLRELGISAATLSRRAVTADRLAAAVDSAVTDASSRDDAERVAAQIAGEDGAGRSPRSNGSSSDVVRSHSRVAASAWTMSRVAG